MHKKRFVRYTVGVVLTLAFCLIALLGVCDFVLPNRITYRAEDTAPAFFGLTYTDEDSIPAVAEGEAGQTALIQTRQAEMRLLGVVPLKTVEVVSYSDLRLYPGGMPFGVKLYTEGILVVGFGDVDSADGAANPAYAAGLRVKDVITHLNGQVMSSVEGMTALIESSGGKPIAVTYKRNGEVYSTTVTPLQSVADGRYKTGMWVRDSGAGIGTVTFIDPTTGAFGGLGHGICDVDTGELMPMQRGTVVDVTISGVVRGAAGAPGELRGSFLAGKRGALIGNTASGVFGVFSKIPENCPEGALPIALKDEIKAGKAYIWCTLDDNGPQKYEVEIHQLTKLRRDQKALWSR